MTSPDVDEWLAGYNNPMREVVQRVRHILLHADDRLTECIKWETPTFQYRGDFASFYPKTVNHATLMIHRGAEIPGKFPHLEIAGPMARSMRIVSIVEAEDRRDELTALVTSWIALRDAKSPPDAVAE